MITIFNRKHLFTTFSMKVQSETREKLSLAGIKYLLKVQNQSARSYLFGSSRARQGSAGINMSTAYIYTFYVHKKDYDRAQYIIDASN